MTDQASENAMARIDRALARIEAAANRQGEALDMLRGRHATLRAEITSAIAALDSLAAGEED
ncbi:hypothetical protein [Sphingomonas sp.]|uniref:hypothetical protein n=1 Tax=Sphingomonas sp. TaxID=28214 RepID=UPI002DD66A59|nr:hypothetical protein [Sphingomonas sp.]